MYARTQENGKISLYRGCSFLGGCGIIGSTNRLVEEPVYEKTTKKSILFYTASALFYMASIMNFVGGNDNSMAVVWLCLGSSFLCLGSTYSCLGSSRKKKENGKADANDE